MNSKRGFVFVVILISALSFGACSKHSAPATPSPSTPATPDPTVVKVVSLEGGAPIAGATLVSSGQTVTTDGSGFATFKTPLARNADIDIAAGGFMKWETRYTDYSFELCPTRPGEFDENFLQELVYGTVGSKRLRRVNGDVYLVLSGDIVNQSKAIADVQRAADLVTNANGKFRFQIVKEDQVPSGGIKVEVMLTNGQPMFLDTVAWDSRGGYIRTGGRALIGGTPGVDLYKVAAHELGHAFGFCGHNPKGDGKGLMWFGTGMLTPDDFSPEEKAAMRYMLKRDNDTVCCENSRVLYPQ